MVMPRSFSLPWIFAASYLMLFLLTWDFGEGLSRFQQNARSLALPVPFIQVLFIALAIIERRLKATLHVFKKPEIWLPLTVLLTISIVDAISVSPAGDYALYRTYFWAVQFLFGWSLASIGDDRFSIRVWIDAMLSIGIVIVLLTFLFSFLIPPERMDWYSGFPMASHIRHLGYYLTVIAALGLAVLCTETSLTRRWLLAFAACFASFLLQLWTGSRGAMLATVGGLLIGFLLMGGLRQLRSLLSLVPLLIAAAVSMVIPVPASHMGVLSRVAGNLSGQSGSITTGRDELWLKNWNAILERPFFGHGDGQMSQLIDHSGTVQSHQVFLQILLAWGFVGFISLAIVAWPTLRRCVDRVRSGDSNLSAPFLVLTSLSVYAMYDGPLYHPITVPLFAACLGLLLRPKHTFQRMAAKEN